MKTYNLRQVLNEEQGELLKGTFLGEDSYDLLVTEDADGYDLNGKLLFRYRKGAMPLEVIRSGYEAFKSSIRSTTMRITASGGRKQFYTRADGTKSNTKVGNSVETSVVGYIDASGKVPYCRKTAFTKDYFRKFSAGVPFIKHVDGLYKDLCPEHYERQMNIAKATDINYRIEDTSFTTVTVNKNFRTAVHKDAGDYPGGFGNLCVYREGSWGGAYFCLPEFRVAIDMQNTDMLFVDVHRWHGNTPFHGEEYLRVSFVMYYREYMFMCKKPGEELKRVKNESGGFFKL